MRRRRVTYKNILYNHAEGIATIRLNRPKQLNALTPELMAELSQVFDAAAADAQARVIVLTGEGRAFCSGADLGGNSPNLPRDAQGRFDLGETLDAHYNPFVLKMRALRLPVIAAVNGLAAGAGCSLALMADLTIAARSAYFLQAFVNVGLVPDAGGTWILPRAAGPQRAMGMALLGDRVPAEQAREWGLIWDVVDDDQLLPAALALAKRLAEGPALAIERIKRALHAGATSDLPPQLALESELQRECGRTQDFMEGAMAFAQKRKANFKGR